MSIGHRRINYLVLIDIFHILFRYCHTSWRQRGLVKQPHEHSHCQFLLREPHHQQDAVDFLTQALEKYINEKDKTLPGFIVVHNFEAYITHITCFFYLGHPTSVTGRIPVYPGQPKLPFSESSRA